MQIVEAPPAQPVCMAILRAWDPGPDQGTEMVGEFARTLI